MFGPVQVVELEVVLQVGSRIQETLEATLHRHPPVAESKPDSDPGKHELTLEVGEPIRLVALYPRRDFSAHGGEQLHDPQVVGRGLSVSGQSID